MNNGEYDSTPLDLDGDGTPDINSSATRSSVISSFQRYAELLTQEDDLTIFITSHGGQINSETYTFALWNDIAGMTSDELANLNQIRSMHNHLLFLKTLKTEFL